MATLTPVTASVPDQRAHEAELTVLGLLHAGIPLTLLCDLATPTGPDSAAIYADEAGDAEWLTA